MQILCFGHHGQTGYYLEKHCQTLGHKFFGASRRDGHFRGDIKDPVFVAEVILKSKPNIIFNLAARSSIQHKYIQEYYDTIVMGNLNILSSVYEYDPNIKVFVTGSGLQFKNEDKPISANDPFDARDAYSAARIAAAYQARYFRKQGLKIYIGYLFHHESKFRNDSCISKRILHAAQKGEKLGIGDINAAKEWGFAGDIAKGIWTLVNQDEIFEATIGTGVAHQIREWFDVCYSHFGLDWQKYHEQIAFNRDFKILVSDPTIMKSLGWSCESNLKRLLGQMI